MFVKLHKILGILILMGLTACGKDPQNDPYPQFEENENILYTAFNERPKHLDPAISYSSEEATFTYQIYEPLLQYHYLKRPFELIPLTTVGMPSIRYLNEQGKEVKGGEDGIAYSVYRISIQPNIYYQDHPAFAKKGSTDQYYYHHLTREDVKDKHTIKDFTHVGTRELIAEDYIYEIKRLADPRVNSPIYGVMENYIQGFKEFSGAVKKIREKSEQWLDLRDIPLQGITLIDRLTFEIALYGKYPQFIQWLAMPFFAPIPWEVDRFYSQPGLDKQNISLDWYPVGTGPFILSENNPNMIMILEKNKNFHGEKFPEEGEPGDEAAGFLINKGKSLPLLDKIVFILEKEDVPYWNKFLQGYYDQSGISTNNFNQALKSMNEESTEISDELRAKGMTLNKSVLPTVFYWGVNMLDDKIGGYSERSKKLRKALSLAFDMEEYITIFLNGRGKIGYSPLPEGIFGYRHDLKRATEGIDDRDQQTQTVDQKKITEAKAVLAEAGYPGGKDRITGRPLAISFEIPISSASDSAAQLGWFRKQFEKLGIELIINATHYSRFQDKLLNGDAQLFVVGWNADYPDPENFLFLFDTENGKVKYRGENATNYSNPEFDKLFQMMKVMDNSPLRQEMIDKMNLILKEDLPWIAYYFPTLLSLKQEWVSPTKPNPIARNTLKYMAIDPALRRKRQYEWNQPLWWPLVAVAVGLVLLSVPAFFIYYRKMHRPLVLKERK